MHGGVHPREVGAPQGPRVARDGVHKKQLLDHDIIRLAGCVPQPPDSVPPHIISHVRLASAGQQLSRGILINYYDELPYANDEPFIVNSLLDYYDGVR